MEKRIIINPFAQIPQNPKSHVRGGSIIWAQRLKAEIGTKESFRGLELYDKIYIDMGINYSGGSINLFGGLTEDILKNIDSILQELENSKEVYILEDDYRPKILECLMKRVPKMPYSEDVEDFINNLNNGSVAELLTQIKVLTMKDLKLEEAILGDSHSIAYSLPHQAVYRSNGLTLHSVLDERLINYIDRTVKTNQKCITLCLSSIDQRMHTTRLNINVAEFTHRYIRQILDAMQLGYDITVCGSVPVEHEERKIPGTGTYKGKPFYGSREERLKFTKDFNNYMNDAAKIFGFKFLMLKPEYYNMDGKYFADNFMEMTSSVHLSPEIYRSVKPSEWILYDYS
jgi:hypothetical protein